MIILKLSTSDIIAITVALVVMGLLLPIGIVHIGNFGNVKVAINGSYVTTTNVLDGSIITMVAVLIPIVVIAVIVRKISGSV